MPFVSVHLFDSAFSVSLSLSLSIFFCCSRSLRVTIKQQREARNRWNREPPCSRPFNSKGKFIPCARKENRASRYTSEIKVSFNARREPVPVSPLGESFHPPWNPTKITRFVLLRATVLIAWAWQFALESVKEDIHAAREKNPRAKLMLMHRQTAIFLLTKNWKFHPLY